MKKRILVVEDSNDNILILGHALKFLGYEMLIAKDGAKGVELAETENPDLIIMDIMLPEMDGLEATSQIRNNPKTQFIPIIAATAMARSGDRETCLRAGCEGYIAKPFTYKDLRHAIDKALNKTAQENRLQGGGANTV